VARSLTPLYKSKIKYFINMPSIWYARLDSVLGDSIPHGCARIDRDRQALDDGLRLLYNPRLSDHHYSCD